jgi:hypothetical protein
MSVIPNDPANPAASTPAYKALRPTNPTIAPVPATIAGNGSWTSGVLPAVSPRLAATAKISQSGTLSIQRYIDAAGTIAIGSAATQALTANTQGTANIADDGVAFASWIVTVVNGSGSTANVSNIGVLQA